VDYNLNTGSDTGSPGTVSIAATGSDATIIEKIADKGGSGVDLYSNGGRAWRSLNSSASAVNYMQQSGSATGLPLAIAAKGTDSSILLRLDDKGGAGVALASNGNYSLLAQNPASAVDYIVASGAATGNPATVSLTATGSDSNINLNLVSKGSGNVQINGTAVASMPLYNASGTLQTTPHTVIGSGTLSAGNLTVTLTGSAVFSSLSSYVCNGNDTGGSAIAVSTQNQSGSSFKIFGTLTDTVSYTCTGN
jgi:hypothetical protein